MAYERIVAAAMKGENALWELGDEIIEETKEFPRSRKSGPARGLHKKIKEISDELTSCGFKKYKEKSLSEIRNTALDFQGPNRFKGIAFSVHVKVQSPEKLRKVVEYAKLIGRTKPVSEGFIHEYEAAEKERRRDEFKAALAIAAEAEEEIAQAEEDSRKANSPQAKEVARKRKQAAEEKRKEASRRAKDLRTAPKVKHDVKPKSPADAPMLVVRTKFAADMSQLRSLVERMDKDVSPHLNDLPDSFVDASAEELLELAEMVRQLSFKVRSRKTNKRSHLYAVGE